MLQILLAIIFVVAAVVAPKFISDKEYEGRWNEGDQKYDKHVKSFGWLRGIIRGVCVVCALLSIFATSFVYVSSDEVGHLKRIYFAKSMKPGQIIAMNGEKGPQAEIIPPGFHFSLFIRFLNDIHREDVVEIPEGSYGYLTARDGEPLRPDQMYADAFDPAQFGQMVTQAKFFLKNGGQKGPQTSIITPGKWRINRFLWDVKIMHAKKIEAGHVGVIKSNVYSRVDFGNLKTEKPLDCTPVQEKTANDQDLAVPIVPVGCIGVWETALNPGEFYINEKAYKVIDVDTRVQTWEYKGGFTRRYIDLKVQANGDITQTEGSDVIEKPAHAADEAVLTRVEGWVVPQELRALVQVTPKNAPFVVASVGGLQEVEDRILTPAIKSVVRNVVGGSVTVDEVVFEEVKEFIYGENGGQVIDKETGQPITKMVLRPVIDKKTDQPKTKTVIRPTKVLDLVENRPLLENEVELIVHDEGLKAGVDIKEIRFGDPAIPPELLVARQREQLAQQMRSAFIEEQKSQEERIITENKKATADQQSTLVEADIQEQRSIRIARAKKNEGQGEKDKLDLIAQGQKSQANVLGEDRVVDLRKFELMIDRVFALLEENPEILTTALSNAQKFVPERLFNLGGGDAAGLTGAFGVLGDMLSPPEKTKKRPIPAGTPTVVQR